MIENYSCVFLLTDRYRSLVAGLGAVGYVIETYGNGDCEVEFSRPDGTTYAQVTVCGGELTLDEPAPVLVGSDA